LPRFETRSALAFFNGIDISICEQTKSISISPGRIFALSLITPTIRTLHRDDTSHEQQQRDTYQVPTITPGPPPASTARWSSTTSTSATFPNIIVIDAFSLFVWLFHFAFSFSDGRIGVVVEGLFQYRGMRLTALIMIWACHPIEQYRKSE
jgi:hypothetical protein